MMIKVVLLGITVSMFIVACSMSRTTTVESAMNIEDVIEHDITNDECEDDDECEDFEESNLNCMYYDRMQDCLVFSCADPQMNDPELKKNGWKPGDHIYEISVDMTHNENVIVVNVIRCFYSFEEYNNALGGMVCETPLPANLEHGCYFEE